MWCKMPHSLHLLMLRHKPLWWLIMAPCSLQPITRPWDLSGYPLLDVQITSKWHFVKSKFGDSTSIFRESSTA